MSRCHKLGDRLGGQTAGWGRGGETEPGQRRHDESERVGWVAAVRGWVGQQRQELQVLAERAGPAVGQQQRQWVRTLPGRVHQVHKLAVEVRVQVGQAVQPGLEPCAVEGPPVRQQLRERVSRHAPLPPLGVSRRQPVVGEPLSQQVERLVIKQGSDRLDSEVAAHPMSISIPAPAV